MAIMTLFQWCSLRSVRGKDLAGIGHALLFAGFVLMFLNYIVFIGLAEGLGLAPFLNGGAFARYLAGTGPPPGPNMYSRCRPKGI